MFHVWLDLHQRMTYLLNACNVLPLASYVLTQVSVVHCRFLDGQQQVLKQISVLSKICTLLF